MLQQTDTTTKTKTGLEVAMALGFATISISLFAMMFFGQLINKKEKVAPTALLTDSNNIPLVIEQEGYVDDENNIKIKLPAPNFQAGWPVTTTTHRFSKPPSIADINNDGEKELVATNEEGIYAWDSKGNILEGWPYLDSQYWNNYFSPSLADIDNDKNMEIFGGGEDTELVGLDHNGNMLEYWPFPLYYQSSTSSITVDLDRNGSIEIVGGKKWPGQTAHVYVWDSKSNVLPGWPKEITETSYVSSITTSDLNNDGKLEIIATGGWKVYIWDINGNSFGTWPKTLDPWGQTFPGYPGTYYNNPIGLATGDINNDGNQELVTFTYNYAYDNALKRVWVHVTKIDGTELEGFPVEIPYLYGYGLPGLTIANIDTDKELEIIAPTLTKLIVVQSDGSYKRLPEDSIPGAQYIGFRGSIVADINGDNVVEIVSPIFMDNDPFRNGNEWGEIYAWDKDGNVIKDFPIELPWSPTSGISVDDIDNDGDIEISGGFEEYSENGQIYEAGTYVIDLLGKYIPGTVEWGTYAHDIHNTNNYKKNVSITPSKEITIDMMEGVNLP